MLHSVLSSLHFPFYLRFCLLSMCLWLCIGRANAIHPCDVIAGHQDEFVIRADTVPDAEIKALYKMYQTNRNRVDVAYQCAAMYYVKGNYKACGDILKRMLNREQVSDSVYAFLAQTYYHRGKRQMADMILQIGVSRYPNSGLLYLVLGTYALRHGNIPLAKRYWESGIEVDPTFAMNYYWAAKLYCSTLESFVGLFYGEAFLNLHHHGDRADEMSELVYYLYQKNLQTTDSGLVSSFTDRIRLSSMIDTSAYQKNLLFGVMVFEPLMSRAAKQEITVDVNSLHRIRSNFLKQYVAKGYNQTYPKSVLLYQVEVLNGDVLQPYDVWILRGADMEAFEEWKQKNGQLWREFEVWQRTHPYSVVLLMDE